jgi:hypothetical protein
MSVLVCIPTTPERRARVDSCLYHIRKYSNIGCSVLIHENSLGGWVPAMRSIMKSLQPAQLVCVLGDDCEPQEGWLEPLETAFRLNFPDGDGIVQPNDNTWNGLIASYPVTTAGYILKWAYSGYTHNFCDNELAETARKRGKYIYVPESLVLHKHHSNSEVSYDETYKLQELSSSKDQDLYNQRKKDSEDFSKPENLNYD